MTIRKKMEEDFSVSINICGVNESKHPFASVIKLKNVLELIEYEKLQIDTGFNDTDIFPFCFVEKLYKTHGFIVPFCEFKRFCEDEYEVVNRNLSTPSIRAKFDEVKKTTTLNVCIRSLNSFSQDERTLLVQYANLVSQDDLEHKIILYVDSIQQILEELETDEKYVEAKYVGFRVQLNELIQLDAAQYIFD